MVGAFADRVRREPDAVAVRHRGDDLTFARLDRWSTRLARELRAAGTGPGDVVALAVDRSPGLVAGVLAVLKAGAGYLALDPDTPVRRQRAMARRVRPSAVLAEPHLDRLPTLDVPRVLLGDQDGPPDAVDPAPAGDDAVFQVVPTSGTTGEPRLVRVPYRAVLNRLAWMWREHPFPEDAVVAVHKSPALVASPWEVLGGLLGGARSVVLDREQVLDPASFASVVADERITHLFLTPHLITGLLDGADRLGGLRHRMRLVTSGADVLAPSLARRFHAAFPGVRLLNLYGMTETASNVAQYDTARLPADATRVPVGRPVAGATITVRDRALRPVPVGVAGEVCVSGPPVALGYLDEDELTAERFVRRPDGTVLYRTGDRGRWLPEGDLEVLGRADNQVKVRGYRVELEEVEAALARVPGVIGAAACVVAEAGGPVLTGCLVTDEEPDPTAVRAHLRDRVPDYAVPGRLVRVAALPLGAQGKVDRRALAEVARTARAGGAARAYEPADEHERVVARCWTEVLGVPPEDAKQNFFHAGGHSLLAVRLANRLQAATGTAVSLRALLEDPSVAAIAALLDGGRR
ncbi:Plipastatin synthase subunit A [Actinosynnema sp. ALI-1.44]